MNGEESWVASRQLARGLRASIPSFGPLLSGLLALALVACSGREEDTATPTPEETGGAASATATASPDAKQVLRANLTSEPSTLDPQRASDQVSLTMVRNLYSGLLRLDAEDRLVTDLAEEVPTAENGGISADGLTYTFRLRDGLQWSDGEPLVAHPCE